MFLYLKITLGYQKYLKSLVYILQEDGFRVLVNYIICSYGCLN